MTPEEKREQEAQRHHARIMNVRGVSPSLTGDKYKVHVAKSKALKAKKEMKPGIHKVGENPSRFVHKGRKGDSDLYETWEGGKQHIIKTK